MRAYAFLRLEIGRDRITPRADAQVIRARNVGKTLDALSEQFISRLTITFEELNDHDALTGRTAPSSLGGERNCLSTRKGIQSTFTLDQFLNHRSSAVLPSKHTPWLRLDVEQRIQHAAIEQIQMRVA